MDTRRKDDVAGVRVIVPRHAVARNLIDDLNIVNQAFGVVRIGIVVQAERGAVAGAREERVAVAVVVGARIALRLHGTAWIAAEDAGFALD